MKSDTPPLLGDLPWPYNGIVRDLDVAIENGCNYLAAMGLVCWSEFLGREIAKARGSRLGNNRDCFVRFVAGYMKYDLGPRASEVYDAFRNGLAHEFAIKGNRTAVATRIYTLDPNERVPGIAFMPTERYFFVEEYFRDFKAGLLMWLRETKRIDW